MGSSQLTFTETTSSKADQKKTIKMAPVMVTGYEEEAMSKTHNYRKVVKPLIERKRRARINSCLDELKDLMVFALTVRVPEQRVPKHMRIASPVSDCGYSSGRDSTPSPQPLLQISPAHSQPSPVWRPF